MCTEFVNFNCEIIFLPIFFSFTYHRKIFLLVLTWLRTMVNRLPYLATRGRTSRHPAMPPTPNSPAVNVHSSSNVAEGIYTPKRFCKFQELTSVQIKSSLFVVYRLAIWKLKIKFFKGTDTDKTTRVIEFGVWLCE